MAYRGHTECRRKRKDDSKQLVYRIDLVKRSPTFENAAYRIWLRPRTIVGTRDPYPSEYDMRSFNIKYTPFP